MAYTPQIYYPSTYAPQYQPQYQPVSSQQMQMQAPQQQAQNNNGLIWVSGEVGAKSYLVAPNTTVMLMDSESSKFYIKSTDNAGMPTIRTYEYTECTQNALQGLSAPQNNMAEQFVTRDEYKALNGKYEALLARVEEMQKPKAPSKKKEAEVDE